MLTRRDFLRTLPLAAALPGLTRAASEPTKPTNPVGCQTNAWQIKAGDFAELLKRAADLKKLDYGHFECNVRFVEGQFANPREARAQIEKTGMIFFGPHTSLRQSAEFLDRAVDGAASLGAKRVALSNAGASLLKDGQLDREALKKKLEAINRLGKRCQKAELRLVYHNHSVEFLGNGAEIEALLKGTDPELVFFLIDVGHVVVAKADAVAFFTKHHSRIDALHLRDVRNGKQVPMGQGDFDFAGLAAAAHKAKWPGWLTVEEESLKSNDAAFVESVLKSSRAVVRKCFSV